MRFKEDRGNVDLENIVGNIVFLGKHSGKEFTSATEIMFC